MTSRTIIFDCDGVLVDSEVIYLEVERACLKEIGLIYDDAEYRRRFIGLKSSDYLRELETDLRARELGTFPDGFVAQMDQKGRAEIKKRLQPVNGVSTFLKALSGKIAVASSSGLGMLHTKLRITGLADYFDEHVYSGEQVENGKPAPDLFLLAADRLQEHPQSCFVVEDSINGVTAAVAAGMTAWGFAGGGHVTADLADQLMEAGAQRVFQTYGDLLNHLQGSSA